MDQKQVYCGTKPLKANQKYGSMKECVNSAQIRLYGLNKIDSRTLNNKTKKVSIVTLRKNRTLLMKQYASLSGKINKLKKDYNKAIGNEKIQLKKAYELEAAKYNDVVKKIKDIDKQLPAPRLAP